MNVLQIITLNTNTGPIISGVVAGQRVTSKACQPASGGPYSFTLPASVFRGAMAVTTIAGMGNVQSFVCIDGVHLDAESLGGPAVAC